MIAVVEDMQRSLRSRAAERAGFGINIAPFEQI
jgi:hypothetical protein